MGLLLGLPLGLVASCDSLWMGSIQTNDITGKCTVATGSLCPSGYVCNFTTGDCDPLVAPNPPGWTVSPQALRSCPQGDPSGPSITISKQDVALSDATVQIGGFDVNMADLSFSQGSAHILLPRELPPGPQQVRISSSSLAAPVVLNDAFTYSTQTMGVTQLFEVTSVTVTAKPVVTLAALRLKKGDPLDLAVVSSPGMTASLGTTLSYYKGTAVGYRKSLAFPSTASMTGAVATANLLTPEIDPVAQPGAHVLIAGTEGTPLSTALAVIDGANGLHTTAGPAQTSLRSQILAAGHFVDIPIATQIITVMAPTQGTNNVLNTAYYPSPYLGGGLATAGNFFSFAQTPTLLAAATGNFNGDGFTDAILLVGDGAGNSYGEAFYGGSSPGAGFAGSLFLNPTLVAVADLNGDGRDDAILARQVANNAFQVVLSNSTASTMVFEMGTTLNFSSLAIPLAIAAADYNGDGRPDIVYTAADGVHVLINNGNSVSASMRFQDTLVFRKDLLKPLPGANWEPRSLVVSEFSGDSRPDFIVGDNLNGYIYFLENGCE